MPRSEKTCWTGKWATVEVCKFRVFTSRFQVILATTDLQYFSHPFFKTYISTTTLILSSLSHHIFIILNQDCRTVIVYLDLNGQTPLSFRMPCHSHFQFMAGIGSSGRWPAMHSTSIYHLVILFEEKVERLTDSIKYTGKSKYIHRGFFSSWLLALSIYC